MSILVLTIRRGGAKDPSPGAIWTNVIPNNTLSAPDLELEYKGVPLVLTEEERLAAFIWLNSNYTQHNQLALIKANTTLSNYLISMSMPASTFLYSPLYHIQADKTTVYHAYNGIQTFQGDIPFPNYNPISYPVTLQSSFGDMDLTPEQLKEILKVIWNVTVWHDITLTAYEPIDVYGSYYNYKVFTVKVNDESGDVVINENKTLVKFKPLDNTYYLSPTVVSTIETYTSVTGNLNDLTVYITPELNNYNIQPINGDIIAVVGDTHVKFYVRSNNTNVWIRDVGLSDVLLQAYVIGASLTHEQLYRLFFNLFPYPVYVPPDIPLEEGEDDTDPPIIIEPPIIYPCPDYVTPEGAVFPTCPPTQPYVPTPIIPVPPVGGNKHLKIRRVSKLPLNPKPASLYLVPSKEPNRCDAYVTNSNTSRTELLKLSSKTDEEINKLISLATSKCMEVYFVDTIYQRNQLMGSVKRSAYIYVNNATEDSSVSLGSAVYLYNYNTQKYIKVFEKESIDVRITWASIEDGPNSTPAQVDEAVAKMHQHPNKPILDAISKDSNGYLVVDGINYGYVQMRVDQW